MERAVNQYHTLAEVSPCSSNSGGAVAAHPYPSFVARGPAELSVGPCLARRKTRERVGNSRLAYMAILLNFDRPMDTAFFLRGFNRLTTPPVIAVVPFLAPIT